MSTVHLPSLSDPGVSAVLTSIGEERFVSMVRYPTSPLPFVLLWPVCRCSRRNGLKVLHDSDTLSRCHANSANPFRLNTQLRMAHSLCTILKDEHNLTLNYEKPVA